MSEFEKILAEKQPPKNEEVDVKEKLKNFQKNIDKSVDKTVRVWLYYIPQILMTILAFLIIGAWQFVEAKFDPKIFLTADFWGNYLTYQSASWILVLNIIATAYKTLKKKHVRYNALKAKRNFYVTLDENHSFIGKYAEIEDRRRKIKAYKIWINQRIHKILEKREIYDLQEFLLETKDITLVKHKKAVKRKLEYLLSVLTDEWIEKNIENVKTGWRTFRYAKVTRDKLVSGAKTITSNYCESDFEEHNVSVFTEYYLSGFIFVSILMFILLSFRLFPKENALDTYVSFVIKVFMIGFSAISTWLKTEETFELTKLKVIEETTSEIGKYYAKEFSAEERAILENDFKAFDKKQDTL